MTGEQSNEDSILTTTRRHALKLAVGTTTFTTLGTAPATAQEQDRQQWAFETGDSVRSSPAVVDRTVFVGSDDTNLYAVEASVETNRSETNGSETNASVPGFGIGSGISAIGTTGYILNRRLTSNSE